MAKSAVQSLGVPHDSLLESLRQVALIVGASLFVALCAQASVSLMPLTPVPLTIQNLSVLLVGLLLGSRRGFAALMLYLVEGMVGLPVFNPLGPGGVAQLFGITGGFLLAYPFVAFVTGYIFEKGRKSFLRAAVAGTLAEIVLFVGGLSWLYIFTHSFKAAYVFVPAEILKVAVAAAVAAGWRRMVKQQS